MNESIAERGLDPITSFLRRIAFFVGTYFAQEIGDESSRARHPRLLSLSHGGYGLMLHPVFLTFLLAVVSSVPAHAQVISRRPLAVKHAERVNTSFLPATLEGWALKQIRGKTYRVSDVLDFGMRREVNHHQLAALFEGDGILEMGLIHSSSPHLPETLARPALFGGVRQMRSGKAHRVSSPFGNERYVWLVLRTEGEVKVRALGHSCWRGQATLYGHVAQTQDFAGRRLPYRLMYPKDYDPSKKYPLVISVHGSGGVGEDNSRNMERVILARYLFTQYYHDPEFQCFSLVPQIPSPDTIPAPYWPKGNLGAPTIAHPDWPTVNEQGWYTQATIALIRYLTEHDQAISIDPRRVYVTGFSYGGKACWEFLKAAPQLFAGAIVGGGWPVGRAFSEPQGKMLQTLQDEALRYCHVPVFVFAGEHDRMRFGSRAVHKAIGALEGESHYVEIPEVGHIPSARKAWSNPETIRWLFDQTSPIESSRVREGPRPR
jgi:acetyl esterase/lipase